MRYLPLLFLASALPALGAYEPLFLIGTKDGRTTGFSREDGVTTEGSGSPTEKDDHYYYPSENVENFERAFTRQDPINVIHFNLTGGQTLSTGRLKLQVNFIRSGTDSEEELANEVSFSLNGGEPFSVTPVYGTPEYTHLCEVSLEGETLNLGDNTLKIERTGGSDRTWTQFDFIEAQLDPRAFEDQDGDQLPFYWEELYLFSDHSSTDAAADPDNDGLTNFEEFQRKTNPLKADSDEDGLLDGAEINTHPLIADSDEDGLLDGEESISDPTSWDSDSDGASDSLELATGYDPLSETSTPPAWAGCIGINFRSTKNIEGSIWPARAANGIIPQSHWNHSLPLTSYGVANAHPLLEGTQEDIEAPEKGTIVNSAGEPTPLTLSFSHDGVAANGFDQSLKNKLFNSYLKNDSYRNQDDGGSTVQKPASVTISDIPYSSYDVYIYLSSSIEWQEGQLLRVGAPESAVDLIPFTVTDNVRFREPSLSASTNHAIANVVRYAALTGSTQAFTISRIDGLTGIAGLQIIERMADSDGDQLPNYWELRHRTGADLANADDDADSDGLTLLSEYLAGTNPNDSDSDDDGLTDGEEDTHGTNPLFADSDQDGLSDLEELTAILPSLPLVSDSDGDGLSDATERKHYADPMDEEIREFPSPIYVSNDEFLWEQRDLQLLIDHRSQPETVSKIDRTLYSVTSRNLSHEKSATIQFKIYQRGDRLQYLISSSTNGGFAKSNGKIIFIRSEFEDDLTAGLGLSGAGSFDTTDPLTFRFQVIREEGVWNFYASLINQRTEAILVDKRLENITLDPKIEDQTAIWGYGSEAGLVRIQLGVNARLFRSKNALESLPALSAYLDSDQDSMPNHWEILYAFDPDSPTDRGLDADGDGVTNDLEYLHGTHPRLADTDNDGINDHLELLYFSNPNDPDSKPALLSGPVTRNRDLDGNGLPDLWESNYQGINLQVGQDSDGDGFTNEQEAEMGTNPLDATSYFALNAENNEGMVSLFWPRITTKSQTLYSSDGLSEFTVHPQPPSSIGDRYSLTMEPREKEFFRVAISDLDTDSDGVTNWEESIIGTSNSSSQSSARPQLRDTDGDGIPDETIDGSSDYAALNSILEDRADLISGATKTDINTRHAARLLLQASFGPTLPSIQEVQKMGISAWIDDQIENQPPTLHGDYLREITADFQGPRLQLRNYENNPDSTLVGSNNIQTAFAKAAISGPDQLRQRVAFALSQILVVSRREEQIGDRIHSMAKYYDMFVQQAFGNYEDLLLDVTLSPIMGWYLSSVGNQKADPSINRFPDENFAREVQQLFSIGLWELNIDGTRKKDANGNDIPTYNNDDITEFARVFTGLWYGNQSWGRGGYRDSHYSVPMDMNAEYHDFGPKRLLNGFTLPKREESQENGMQDIRDTIHHLVTHPSCAPFISKALIQFLVTSNPSPAYVERVAHVFQGNETQRAGDLKAVIKAILLDPEARDPGAALQPDYGIFREPVIRNMHLARLLKINRNNDIQWWSATFSADTLQAPLSAPNVFNFFRPDYSPPGTLSDNNLFGPAFEILDTYTSISVPNHFWDMINRGFSSSRYRYPPDFGDFMPFADDHPTLIDKLNLVLCGGSMTFRTREIILNSLDQTYSQDDAGRVRLAIYLTLMSPDGSTQR